MPVNARRQRIYRAKTVPLINIPTIRDRRLVTQATIPAASGEGDVVGIHAAVHMGQGFGFDSRSRELVETVSGL